MVTVVEPGRRGSEAVSRGGEAISGNGSEGDGRHQSR